MALDVTAGGSRAHLGHSTMAETTIQPFIPATAPAVQLFWCWNVSAGCCCAVVACVACDGLVILRGVWTEGVPTLHARITQLCWLRWREFVFVACNQLLQVQHTDCAGVLLHVRHGDTEAFSPEACTTIGSTSSNTWQPLQVA